MDKAWFSDQIREREAAMYALAMSYMKQEDDALDCMQQSILKAYEHLDTLRDPEKFKPWLYGILINCCKDELRRRKRPSRRRRNRSSGMLWTASVNRIGRCSSFSIMKTCRRQTSRQRRAPDPPRSANSWNARGIC